jgi:hypothetical protein
VFAIGLDSSVGGVDCVVPLFVCEFGDLFCFGRFAAYAEEREVEVGVFFCFAVGIDAADLNDDDHDYGEHAW